MKSSFELAMERLNKTAPATKLSADQKNQIAELESRYKAKIAEREIALKAEMATTGERETLTKLQEQLAHDRKKLLADLEEKKEQVWKL